MENSEKIQTSKRAILELIGATCTSCAIGIEHMGGHFDGVSNIWVDKKESRIYVDYNGDTMILEKICDFVFRIGYQANIIQTE